METLHDDGYAHEVGLGTGEIDEMEMVGEDIFTVDFGFKTRRRLMIWGKQLLCRAALRLLEKPLRHSPPGVWFPLAANLLQDSLWCPAIERWRMGSFMRTEWGESIEQYWL